MIWIEPSTRVLVVIKDDLDRAFNACNGGNER